MTEDEIAVEIGQLAGLDLFALRDQWRALCGSEPPQRMSRELMMRAVASGCRRTLSAASLE
jgi:hypothetical protein